MRDINRDFFRKINCPSYLEYKLKHEPLRVYEILRNIVNVSKKEKLDKDDILYFRDSRSKFERVIEAVYEDLYRIRFKYVDIEHLYLEAKECLPKIYDKLELINKEKCLFDYIHELANGNFDVYSLELKSPIMNEKHSIILTCYNKIQVFEKLNIIYQDKYFISCQLCVENKYFIAYKPTYYELFLNKWEEVK